VLAYAIITIIMRFGKGGKHVYKKAKPQTKYGRAAAIIAAKIAADIKRKTTNRAHVAREPEAEAAPEAVSTISERDDMGLLKLTQEMVRSYVIVAYVSRFQEPAEEDWKRTIAVLVSEGIPMDRRTIRQIFKKCAPKVGRGIARRSARRAVDPTRNVTNRVDVAREAEAAPDAEAEAEAVPALSEREKKGLLKVTQEMVRSYVIVAFVSRFQEPAEEDWKRIVAVLVSEGVPMDPRTIRQIFKNCQAGNTSSKQKSGAGRKRKLEPDNVGLAAATRVVDGGISPKSAKHICNEANRGLVGIYLHCDHLDL
jgi:predicted component of type VI protein secretion system